MYVCECVYVYVCMYVYASRRKFINTFYLVFSFSDFRHWEINQEAAQRKSAAIEAARRRNKAPSVGKPCSACLKGLAMTVLLLASVMVWFYKTSVSPTYLRNYCRR